MPNPERRDRLLLALALCGLCLVYQAVVPPLSAPDEAEHDAYVRAILAGRLPVLAELPKPVRQGGRVIGFAARPTGLAGPATYQAQHPPLAYLAYAAWYRLLDAVGAGGRLVRLPGLLWGLLALYALCRLADEVFARGEPSLLRGALPACALLPAPVFLCVGVTNDGLAYALGCLLLWRTMRLFTQPPAPREALWLALLLGAGLVTKLTLAAFVPFSVAVWLVRRGRAARPLLGFALALLPVALWALRNQQLYGVALPRAHANPLLYGWHQLAEPDAAALLVTQVLMVLFGAVPATLLPGWLLPLWGWTASQVISLAVLVVVLLAGVGLVRRWRAGGDRGIITVPLALYAVMVALLLQQFVWQDFEIGIHGGRYLVPVLGALVGPLLLGAETMIDPPRRRLAGRLVAGGCVAAHGLILPLFGGVA